MQMAGHTLSATDSAIRSSTVAKPSASHTFISFDAFMERTIADMYSSSLPGPQELGCWMAGRRYDRVLATKHEPSYPLRPATDTSATKTVPECETEQCPIFWAYALAPELQKPDARICAFGK